MVAVRLAVGPAVLLMSLALGPLTGSAQTCPDPGSYCEGWSRDSSRRELSLVRNAICNPGACVATCSTAPIAALPSIRIGSYDHVVLGFSVTDACPPECLYALSEWCYNLGVSYRRTVATGSEAVGTTYDCDLTDPGTIVSAGATFEATYETGGTDNIVISNVVYGTGIPPDNCGEPPTALDLTATGPTLGIQSHFTFTWYNRRVIGYTEARTYTALPPPNTVHITVTDINDVLGTYTASAPDALTPTRSMTWGGLKIKYR